VLAQETEWDMATHSEAGGFGELDPAIQKLEFKVTVLPPEEPKVQAELRRAENPARRKVYFYDTPGLALLAKDLVLRARVTDGDDDDSTVKLRPLPLASEPWPSCCWITLTGTPSWASSAAWAWLAVG
jgi:hypothetical protein